MSKRVFELSKELNTTSKRLIEKLKEINIPVKSHMSLLEDDELKRLYKHIGVVNRTQSEDSDDEKSVNQQPQPQRQQVRKDIPRVIRKTEIIIHDEDYNMSLKDQDKEKKKSKKSYVRASSSTDGLMAGLQRDRGKNVAAIKKHDKSPQKGQDRKSVASAIKKTEEQNKVAQEIFEEEVTSTSSKNDRVRRPMDSILSIKKVSPADLRDKSEADEEPVLQDKKTDDEIKIKSDKNKIVSTKDTVKKDSEKDIQEAIDNQKETVSAEAEKSKEYMVQNIQTAEETKGSVAEQTDSNAQNLEVESKPLSTAKDGERQSPTITKEDEKQPLTISNEKEPLVDEKETKTPDTVVKQPPVSDTAVQSDEKESKELHQLQTKKETPETKGTDKVFDKKDSEQRNPKDRISNEKRQQRFNRQAGEKGSKAYSNDRGANRKENVGEQRVVTGSREADSGIARNAGRGKSDKTNYKDGDFRQFSRDSDDKRSDRSRGDNRGFNRAAGDGRSSNRVAGDSRGFNRDRGQDQRDKAGNISKPLVIPKVNLAPGQVEEKNNLRGERRTAVTRDLEKGFRREAKKELPRKDAKAPITSGTNKAKKKYKDSFVVGHTASVKDMYSDEFVLNEFYTERDKLKKDKRGRRLEKHIPQKAVLHEITIPEIISVKNLSEALKKTSAEVIKKLIGLGIMATLNQELDFDTAAIIGDEFKIKVNKEVVVSDEDILFDDMEDKEEDLVARAPVVVVMGHVDHGKTSLLDAIRETRVADNEAGGITQHIGAYKVKINDRDITFLDTPGHEAFTAMRARGAQATDIAILVVAADDGVMPQTIEAINHAKAANVSIIVAINKIDKSGANPDRVKQELADRGVLIEEWGGDVIAVPVSAKNRTNIDQLLEMVILTADILELKANPNKQAKGIVIEGKLDKSRGPVATLLIQRGTLHTGDSIISGTTFGRIRVMTNENGKKIDDAGPSTPIEVTGMDEVPTAGDIFYAVSDDRVAKHLVDMRKTEQREKSIGKAPRVTLDDLFNQIKQGDVKELNIIVKADVQGSVEAITQSIEKLSNDEVKVKVIHGGVGAVNEADVTLASVSNAIIIGFNVRPPANVAEEAISEGVDMRLYRVIYNALEDIEKAMKGLLDPMYKEVVDGHIEIRQTFKASNVGTIGGGYVMDGKVLRNSEVRIVRNGIVVYEGKLASLKRFKDDVKEVAQGYECGILIEKYNDIKEGDIIESFRMEEVERA